MVNLFTKELNRSCIPKVNQWWSKVCKIAVHWLLGEKVNLYNTLEAVPRVLQVSSDPLAMAVVAALR